MSDTNSDTSRNGKPSTTLQGKVEKIIKSPAPDEPEKAEIAVPDVSGSNFCVLADTGRMNQQSPSRIAGEKNFKEKKGTIP